MKIAGKEALLFELIKQGTNGDTYLAEYNDKVVIVKQLYDAVCDRFEDKTLIESELEGYNILKTAGIKVPNIIAYDEEALCIVKEYIQGPTILQMIQNHEDIDQYIPQAQAIEETLKPLNCTADFFPNNFVVRDGELWLVDYEIFPIDPDWGFEKWGKQYWGDTVKLKAYLDLDKPKEEELDD